VYSTYFDVLPRDELELELILSHMTQKPMLRGEVGARALRVRSDVRGHGQARLACPSLDTHRRGCRPSTLARAGRWSSRGPGSCMGVK
jgi:hypothetical protein